MKKLYAIYDPGGDKFFRIKFGTNTSNQFLANRDYHHVWDRKFHYCHMHRSKCTVFEMEGHSMLTKYVFDFCLTHAEIGATLLLVELDGKEPNFMNSLLVNDYFEHYFEGFTTGIMSDIRAVSAD